MCTVSSSPNLRVKQEVGAAILDLQGQELVLSSGREGTEQQTIWRPTPEAQLDAWGGRREESGPDNNIPSCYA